MEKVKHDNQMQDKRRLTQLAASIIIMTASMSFGNTAITEVNDVNDWPDSINQYINALQSKEEHEREEAANSIKENYKKLVDDLIKLASVELPPEPLLEDEMAEYAKYCTKESAIILLGYIRAAKAVPVLIENLRYTNPFDLGIDSHPSMGTGYPAAGSLASIGRYSVEPALEKLRDFNVRSSESEACCWILQTILGSKLAQARIQIAIDETKDEKVKKNLNDAKNHIKTRWGNNN